MLTFDHLNLKMGYLGYLCANFSLPRPLRSQVRPDVRDRQVDRRQGDSRQTSDVRKKNIA